MYKKIVFILTMGKSFDKYGLLREISIAGIDTLGLKVPSQGMRQDSIYANDAAQEDVMVKVR